MCDFVDYIGPEICADIKSDVETAPSCGGGVHPRRWSDAAARGYPPPMRQAAWVMRKYHTSDGRLIIKEERLERREYFQVRRCNGRLVLNLVTLDDAVSHRQPERLNEEEVVADEIDGGDEGIENEDDRTVDEAFSECFKNNCCGGFRVALPAFKPVIT